MRQATLASVGFERYAKTTRRAAFLADMERVVPWLELCALIEPVYSKPGNGRPPVGLERMLRIYFLQQWFNLSDPAVRGRDDVHPARPPLIWSSEAKRRAMWYGSSKVVEAVAMRPMCSVTIANADRGVSVSKEVAVALRLNAAIGMFSTARWSAMKNASKQPRSGVWMNRTRCFRLKFASGNAPG